MSELKQCPFCGSEAQVNTWTMHGITESRCFCSNSDCPNSVRTVGLDQWNTRPIEDALNARIAELEYQLEDWTNNGWAEDYKARIAELEEENAMLKQLPQPIKFWSDEKKQIYKINERRTVKSGSEEREE